MKETDAHRASKTLNLVDYEVIVRKETISITDTAQLSGKSLDYGRSC
jgi:hypothetical protein